MAEQFIQIELKPPSAEFIVPQKVRDVGMGIFGDTTRGATFVLHGAILPLTPQFLGFLRNSILPQTIISTDQILGQVATSCPYALPVETGSKPHWAPIEPLKLWARRKLGDESIAYAIQRAIARRGTRAHLMFTKGFDERGPTVVAMFERAVEKFVEQVSKL